MSSAQAQRVRHGINLALYLLGTVLVLFSLTVEFLGIDITPGFGVVQMVQLLLGLSFLTLALFLTLKERRRDVPRSLQADIGVRLAATGLVFAYVAGLSDLIGIGTHVVPNFERPFVGPLQLGGLGLGVLSIVIGAILYYTSRGARRSSSMEFLLDGNGNGAATSADRSTQRADSTP
jgi:hypothetical protein